MKVLKFGGTSVGSAQRMKDVAKLICDGEQKIVVLSAMSGTTNTLVEISRLGFSHKSTDKQRYMHAICIQGCRDRFFADMRFFFLYLQYRNYYQKK